MAKVPKLERLVVEVDEVRGGGELDLEIRDRSFESQAFRASGLNLVVSAIVHWNTVYIDRAVTQLRRGGRDIPDTLLKHISPLSWEHINLTGIYTWDAEHQMPNGFRSLRLPAWLQRVA